MCEEEGQALGWSGSKLETGGGGGSSVARRTIEAFIALMPTMGIIGGSLCAWVSLGSRGDTSDPAFALNFVSFVIQLVVMLSVIYYYVVVVTRGGRHYIFLAWLASLSLLAAIMHICADAESANDNE